MLFDGQTAPAPAADGARTSFAWVYRLYDVERETADMRARMEGRFGFRRLYPGEVAQAAALAALHGGEAAARWAGICSCRSPATLVGAFEGADLVALGLYDADSRGTVGPLLCPPALAADVQAALLAETLLAMQHHGYLYAVEFDVPADLAALLGARAGTPRLLEPERLTARDRDLDLPFADIFWWLYPQFAGAAPPENDMIRVRRPFASERDLVVGWIAREFGRGWASEMEKTFSHHPISSVIGVRTPDGEEGAARPEDRLLGFCCYDSAGLGVSSTIAVHPAAVASPAGSTIGRRLLEACCREMYRSGYRYFIGMGVSRRRAFFRLLRMAWAIPGSHPGSYRGVIDTL